MYPTQPRTNPNFVTYPARSDAGAIASESEIVRAIRALSDADSNARVNACNLLRCVPRDKFAEVWARARPVTARVGWGEDCLRRMSIEFPTDSQCERALVSVVSPGYERYLRMCLDSFHARAASPETRVFVFALNESYDVVKTWPRVTAIRCAATARLSPAVKGAIYSCASFLDAKSIISVEADMLFLDSIETLWATIENAHETMIWGCRYQGRASRFSMREVLSCEQAPLSDLEWLTGREGWDSKFWFNGGLIAGKRAAWLDVEARIKSFSTPALAYVDGGFHLPFTDEFVFNLAVGMMENRGELSPIYNCQIISSDYQHWMKTERDDTYSRLGERVKIAHFLDKQRPYMDVVAREMGLI